MAFRRKVQALCKNNLGRVVLALLCILVAFTNLIILSILQTNAHQRPENVFESVFSIHVHENITVFNQRDPQFTRQNLQNLTARKEQMNPRQIAEGKKKNTSYKHTLKLKLKKANSDKKTMTTKKPSGGSVLHRLQPGSIAAPKLKDPRKCNTWCDRGNGMKPPYRLTAVLLVRIYRHDLAGLSSREMFQWLQYLRYAGFQHVYVYDAYVTRNESQLNFLKPLIQSVYVT